MKSIKETVTIERDIDYRLANLIHFARSCEGLSHEQLEDDASMVARAHSFWDMMHGED